VLGSWSILNKHMLVFTASVIMITTGLLTGLASLRTELLRNEAQTVADQVLSFRAWVDGSDMIWVDKLAPNLHDFLIKRYDAASGGSYYGKNPDLAVRELSTISNKNSGRASFKITSDRYRHEANKPNSFELRAIKLFKEDSESKFAEEYQGKHYLYANPLIINKKCLQCHGDPIDAPRVVVEKYGEKNAFGYVEGEVCGIISIQLPTVDTINALRGMANPLTISLLALTIIINLLYISMTVTTRLRRLTTATEAIAGGQLALELKYKKPGDTSDEIDHAYHAINLLKQSLKITIKHYKNKNRNGG